MAKLTKAGKVTKYNDPVSGLYKANMVKAINSARVQAHVQDDADSVLFYLDDFEKYVRQGTQDGPGTADYPITLYNGTSPTPVNDSWTLLVLSFDSTSTGPVRVAINGGAPSKVFKDSTTQAGAGDIKEKCAYLLRRHQSLDGGAGGWIMIGGAGGATSDGKSLQQTHNKPAHGFALGDVLTLDSTGTLVRVSDSVHDEIIGIVIDVIDADHYVLHLDGYYTIAAIGLSPGLKYWASDAGTLVPAPWHVDSKLVLIATSTTNGYMARDGRVPLEVETSWKNPVDLATTGPLTGFFTGEQIVDGVMTNLSRVLVKDQAIPAQNGLYDTQAGVWTRTTDANTGDKLEGAAVNVLSGTTNHNQNFLQIVAEVTVDVTPNVWADMGRITSVPPASPSLPGIAKLYPTTGTNTDGAIHQKGITDAINSAVVGLLDYRGSYDASVNAYPSTGGSGAGGAIMKADAWVVTVGGTLPTGQVVEVGDWLIAKIDTPGNIQANWNIIQYNIMLATPTTAGIAKLYQVLGPNTDGAVAQAAVTAAITAATPPPASPTVAGIAKLYQTTGANTDGAMDQKSITDALNDKVEGGFNGSSYWNYNNALAPPPASGRIRLNSLTPSLITEMYLHEISGTGYDVSSFFAQLYPGDSFYLQQKNDATRWIRATLKTAPTDNGVYWTIPLTIVSSSGAMFVNAQDVVVRLVLGPTSSAGIAADMNLKANKLWTIVAKVGSYTLAAAELTALSTGTSLVMEGNGTGDLTVPPNATVAFAVGDNLRVRGFLNVIAGAGVTVTGTNGTLAITTGATNILEQKTTNNWILHNGTVEAAKSVLLLIPSAAVSAGSLSVTLDKQQSKITIPTTQTAGFLVNPTHTSDFEVATLSVPITGTIDVEFPSSFLMNDNLAWNAATHKVTCQGATNSIFEFSWSKHIDTPNGTKYLLKATKAYI